jgi:hypothetical protein
MEALLALLGLILLIPLLLIYSGFSWGWVLYKFWYWFLIPVFPQIPHIGFYMAVGISVFLNVFKNHDTNSIKDEYKDNKYSRIGMSLAHPWIMLCAGWVIWLVIR